MSASSGWIFSDDEYVQVMIKKKSHFFPIFQQEKEAWKSINVNQKPEDRGLLEPVWAESLNAEREG